MSVITKITLIFSSASYSCNNKDILEFGGVYPSAFNTIMFFNKKNCWNACNYVLSKQLDVWNVYWAITSYCMLYRPSF